MSLEQNQGLGRSDYVVVRGGTHPIQQQILPLLQHCFYLLLGHCWAWSPKEQPQGLNKCWQSEWTEHANLKFSISALLHYPWCIPVLDKNLLCRLEALSVLLGSVDLGFIFISDVLAETSSSRHSLVLDWGRSLYFVWTHSVGWAWRSSSTSIWLVPKIHSNYFDSLFILTTIIANIGSSWYIKRMNTP